MGMQEDIAIFWTIKDPSGLQGQYKRYYKRIPKRLLTRLQKFTLEIEVQIPWDYFWIFTEITGDYLRTSKVITRNYLRDYCGGYKRLLRDYLTDYKEITWGFAAEISEDYFRITISIQKITTGTVIVTTKILLRREPQGLQNIASGLLKT